MATPKRFQWPTGRQKQFTVHGGVSDPAILALLGKFIVTWNHAEHMMIVVFEHLLNLANNFDTAKLIFTSIINAQTRIEMMRTLLESGVNNANKSADFDALLDEFAKLNKLRNTYVHGLWFTNEKSGRACIKLDMTEFMPSIDNFQVVTQRELELLIERANKFANDAFALHQRETLLKVEKLRAESGAGSPPALQS